jgi:hypothetical protein
MGPAAILIISTALLLPAARAGEIAPLDLYSRAGVRAHAPRPHSQIYLLELKSP